MKIVQSPPGVIVDPAKLVTAQIAAGHISANMIISSAIFGHKIMAPSHHFGIGASNVIFEGPRAHVFKSTEVWLFVVCAVFWGLFGGFAARVIAHQSLRVDWVLPGVFLTMGLMFLVVQLIAFRLNSQNKFLIVDHILMTGQRP